MRKILFLISAFIIISTVVVLFIYLAGLNNPDGEPVSQITPFPTVTGTQIPQGDRLEISNIEVNNFYSGAERIDPQRNVYIADDRQRYQILYEEQFNLFLITILDSPFQELRNEAEQRFITELGISEEDACFLNVHVTTPAFANPDFSGKSHRLSFCEQ